MIVLNVSAQEYVHPSLEALVRQGKGTVLADSLRSHSYPPKVIQYYTLWTQVMSAKYATAEETLNFFSAKDRGMVRMLIPAIRIAAAKGDMDAAQGYMEKISKVRTSDSLLVADIHNAEEWLRMYTRMADNAVPVEVVDADRGDLVAMVNRLELLSRGVGKITEHSYETPDGAMRLSVQENAPGLKVSYKLGNGEWEAPQEISMTGLKGGGRLSYPILMPDGMTVYFSYSGPETLGGSDLYVTRWDRNENQLLVPQHLPIPFNSGADDFVYLPLSEDSQILLLTSRGEDIGMAKLLLLRKSESSVTQADSLGTHSLLLDSIIPTDPGRLAQLADKVSDSRASKGRGEPLFLIGSKPIYGVNDLTQPLAKVVFANYEKLRSQLVGDLKSLASLRKRWGSAPNPSAKESLKQQILDLEKEVLSKEAAVKALRNEVIRSELNTGSH